MKQENEQDVGPPTGASTAGFQTRLFRLLKGAQMMSSNHRYRNQPLIIGAQKSGKSSRMQRHRWTGNLGRRLIFLFKNQLFNSLFHPSAESEAAENLRV